MYSRKQIVRSFKLRGWQLQQAALRDIEDYLAESNEDLENVLDAVAKRVRNKVVTKDVWDAVLDDANEHVKDTIGTSSQFACFSDVQVVNAFQTPKLVYEPMRKQFHVQDTPQPLFGLANDKTNMLAQRYALTHQRILRHKQFRPNDLYNARDTDQLKLTPVQSLLGKRSHSQSLLLLGVLVQIEEGQFYLEDPTGQVAISLQHAKPAGSDFFLSEHSIVLVEGTFRDDILYAQKIGQPMLESRQTSLASIQQQVAHKSFQLTQKSQPEDSAFVILSDVQLDRPQALQQLEGLFASYSNYTPSRLPFFILMGNFTSRIQSQSTAVKEAIGDLISLISKFPTLAQHAHFCLVPGPNDSPSPVLPLPPLPSTASLSVQKLHMGSNPCRIHWGGREMLIFRHDLLHLLQQGQIRLSATATNEPNERLVQTLLAQGHLVPVAGVPIYWNYDHALRTYPLPTTLVLGGDNDAASYHLQQTGCDVIHPGSVALQASYAVFQPHAIVDDERERRVQFFQFGNAN